MRCCALILALGMVFPAMAADAPAAEMQSVEVSAGETPAGEVEAGRAPTPLENIAKTAIQAAMSRVLETKVTVDRVSYDPREGTLKLTDLRIDNPEGFDQEKPVIQAAEVFVEARPDVLISREPTINVIRLNGAKINAEQNLREGVNVKKLLDSASRFKAMKPLQRRLAGTMKSVRLEKGVMEECAVTLVTELLAKQTREWDLEPIDMDFTEGGTAKPQRVDKLMSQALTRIVQEVLMPQGDGSPESESPLAPVTGLLELLK